MKKANKIRKLKKPKLPKQLSNVPLKRTKTDEERLSEALSTVPRITNETVGEHREEVLSSARKYIYPLQHSKHKVVRISVVLLLTVLISFFAYCGLALYKFQATGSFMHNVTRIIPFPVAKAGNDWVSYESYLFELRRNMHYYRTQQQTDFSSKDGKIQLDRLKRQAMSQVVQDAYVKRLAAKNDVTVSNQAVDNQVELVRQQNRLGNNDQVFRDVLREFWGWSEADFKRELKQQMLQQAVVAKLDTKTAKNAEKVLGELKKGADFAVVAKGISQDPATKANGGQYPQPLTPGEREIPPAITAEVFRLKAGQLSGIINTGYTLEIIKVLEISPDSAKAAHIQFNLRDITTYVKPLQGEKRSRQFIRF
jgi:parvulin-like peptidyl-prolyl isomerase